MKDLKLNPSTHDLMIEKNDFAFVNGEDSIRQRIKIRLKFIFGEWFLDLTKGIKYIEIMSEKPANMETLDNAVKTAISETNGVTSLISYESSLDKKNRIFSISYSVLTEYSNVLTNEENISL